MGKTTETYFQANSAPKPSVYKSLKINIVIREFINYSGQIAQSGLLDWLPISWKISENLENITASEEVLH
jgi:hypothetical protein